MYFIIIFAIIDSKEGVRMEKAEFKICEMQLTIFTPNIFFKKNKILKDIMESYSDKFDGDIISIPVPDDAPKEIPRV